MHICHLMWWGAGGKNRKEERKHELGLGLDYDPRFPLTAGRQRETIGEGGIGGARKRMRWCREVFSVRGSGSCAHAIAPSVAPIVTAASFCSSRLVLPFQNSLFKFKFTDSSSLALTHRKHLLPAALPLTQPSTSREDDFHFLVVNFYHFVFIQDPQAEVAKHRSFLELQVAFIFFMLLFSCYHCIDSGVLNKGGYINYFCY